MQDYLNYIEKLSQGLTAIRQIPDIEYQYNHRELVYQHDKIKLYYYHPRAKKMNATPLLVVFSTVNRPEILDLFPEQSFIRGLLDNGMDVYFIDWGYPEQTDSDISLADYVTKYLHNCVQFITEKKQCAKVNLLGICQGGLLSLCYASITSRIKNLVLISTPIDFHTHDNLVTKLIRKISFDQLISNVSGSWLTQFFISLRPFDLLGKKYLRFVDNVTDEERTSKFLRVEKWLHDAPDQPASAFAELANDFYKANKLVQGEISLAGQKIKLANLTMPVLNIMASDDEIVPPSASKPLKKYVGTQDYSQRTFNSGHIGIYVSEKVGKRMPKIIASWLKKRERV